MNYLKIMMNFLMYGWKYVLMNIIFIACGVTEDWKSGAMFMFGMQMEIL